MYRYLVRAQTDDPGRRRRLDETLSSYPSTELGETVWLVWTDDTLAELHRELVEGLADGDMLFVVEIEGPVLHEGLEAEAVAGLAEDPVYGWEEEMGEDFVGTDSWLICLEKAEPALQQRAAEVAIEHASALEVMPDTWMVAQADEGGRALLEEMAPAAGKARIVLGQLQGRIRYHGLPEWVVEMLESEY